MESRYLLFLLFVCNLLCMASSRPQPMNSDENEAEDAEYAGGDPGDDDSANENEEAGFEDQALSYEQLKEERDKNADDAENLNEEYKENIRAPSKYSGDEESPKTELMLNQNNRYANSNEKQREESRKRTVDYQPQLNEEGDSIFETNNDKNDANNQNENPNEQSRCLHNFFKTMQAANKGVLQNKKYGNGNHQQFLRDRRDALKTDELNLSSTPLPKLEEGNDANEDEESAIKRHVKKLSGAELEELLKSLSEDKRALLKKIMDSDSEMGIGMNKREIDKKEGHGSGESNLLESGQLDSGKSQSFDSSDSNNVLTNVSVFRTSEFTDKMKEINVSDSTDEKPELTIEPKVDKSPIKDSESSNQGTDTKIETKREITSVTSLNNRDELSKVAKIKNESYDDGYSSDDDLSQLMEEESQLHDDNLNDRDVSKRELNERDLPSSDSMKALSESFPNSKMYDESNPYSNSDMAPLIRVKRTNPEVQKRDTAFQQSDAKVAYVPYGSENNDENIDEGNEFDNDEFFERSNIELDSARKFESDSSANDINQYQSINFKSDTMNLGTDTDSVLSGVEDVDENLMFSSGARNRRTDENNIQNVAGESENISNMVRSIPSFVDESVAVSDRNNINSNAPQYRGDDAFGQLPHNYDKDLGRYKRVRHVKQKPISEIDSIRS